jgi:hypothetical protein
MDREDWTYAASAFGSVLLWAGWCRSVCLWFDRPSAPAIACAIVAAADGVILGAVAYAEYSRLRARREAVDRHP